MQIQLLVGAECWLQSMDLWSQAAGSLSKVMQ
jgi:hypothetical protein